MNLTDHQVCALRELALAKLAFDRAHQEFLRVLLPRSQDVSAAALNEIDSKLEEFYASDAGSEPRSIDAQHLMVFTDIVAMDASAESAVTAQPPSTAVKPTFAEATPASQVAPGVVLYAPQLFADAAFLAWLNDGQRKMTWHKPGEQAGEFSDVVVLVDPSLNGEGSDSDMPEYAWELVMAAVMGHFTIGAGGHHIMVRIVNMELA